MRTVFFCCLLLAACGPESRSQSGNSKLLSEAQEKLETKTASVSHILSDKKYLPLHHESSFRELVKKHSNDSILTIATTGEPGKKIRVMGVVTDASGKPVDNALVYMYQTDAKGWYAAENPHVGGNNGDSRHARLFGYVRTNAEGKFEMHTIKPSGYPKSELPAHIHVQVDKSGYRTYHTEFLFDDDDRLVGDIRRDAERSSLLISKPEPAPKYFDQQFSYTMILHN
jgi:protocatechuate 3,4-dioxygenase beta subunit